MGLSTGRHPMALRRDELAMRGILRASDLHTARHGRRVRVAGMVITRQRPGTAKGFVFLTLEDETGIANIIVRPDLFARDRLVIVEEPFLIVDGVLQNQDGVTAASLTLAGVISDGGNNATLLKTGGGDVILSGVNTYGGVTEVQQGQLVVGNSGALSGVQNGVGTLVDAGAA